MHLSLFSDYSLRVLMYAALKKESFQLDEVTAVYGISRNHLAKVVNHLSHLGYLDTKRGRGGGISLAMNPEDIQIGKLMHKTEGQPSIVECFDAETNTCKLSGRCLLKGLLAEAMNAFYTKLNEHTLADLVTGAAGAKVQKALQTA